MDIITRASASSEYASDRVGHDPMNLHDGDKGSNWTEGESGAGMGESGISYFDDTCDYQTFILSE